MIRVGGGALAAALLSSSVLAAQAARSGTSAAGAGTRFVAIGCLSRQGTAAAPRYVITDPRGEKPLAYRLAGDAAQLQQHVGHTMEAAGTLSPAAGGTPSILNVESLVWLASTCRPPAGR